MRATSKPIVGLPITRLSFAAALEACAARARARSGGVVSFVSLHTLTTAGESAAYRELLSRSTFNFADGVSVVWLSALKGDPIPGRVRGPELMPALLALLGGMAHAFVGGAPTQAERIARGHGLASIWACPRYPSALTPGELETRAREDWAALVTRSPAGAPPVCWVGLGSPKQERWMHAVARDAPETLFFGVGAAFDFLAGDKPRAPRLVQRAGLEWLHRLGSEPRRLGRRYLLGGPKLARIALRDLRGRYEAPGTSAE